MEIMIIAIKFRLKCLGDNSGWQSGSRCNNGGDGFVVVMVVETMRLLAIL